MLSPEILAGTRVTLGRGSWLLQLALLVHVAAGQGSNYSQYEEDL